jgi:hypothetical protein
MGLLDLFKKKKKGDKGAPLIDPNAAYRTEEQEKVVWYFSDKNKKGCLATVKGCFKKDDTKGCFKKKKKVKVKGCFPKKMPYISDAEYDAIVNGIVEKLNPQERGLKMLGIDESEIKNPIIFKNYMWNDDEDDEDTTDKDFFYWRFGEDGVFRSSRFQVTYLFFTQHLIAAYQLVLSCDWKKYDETTYEYHYKDITSLKANTVQKDDIKDIKGDKPELKTELNRFDIIVPNDSFYVSLGNKPTPEEEKSIRSMKNMLREKKKA